ncbi:MAG: hypothetical protein FD167_3483, partial [bacterium]
MNINSLSGQNPINSPVESSQPPPNVLPSENEPTPTTTLINTSDSSNTNPESKTQNTNFSANMLKMNLLAKTSSNNQTQPNTTQTASTLSNKLDEIKGLSQDKNYLLTISLPKPKDEKNQPIDPNQLTASDYENTFIKETLSEVGINNVTSSEVKLFQEQYKTATGKDFNLKNPLSELRSNTTTNGELTVQVSQYDLAVAKTVGTQTILAQRQTKSQIAEKAYSDGTKYVDDLMIGYIAARVNAPINLVNGLTEPIRGIASLAGKDLSGLVLPRWDIAKQSEYWNKGDRISNEETGTTLGLAVATNSAIGQILLSNPVGRASIAIESAYNLGTGAAGLDPTSKNTDGTYQELSIANRALRIVGGVLGGASLSASSKPKLESPELPTLPTTPIDPTAPALVTPEGITFNNWPIPIAPSFKPAVPDVGGNVSRPNSFTPPYSISGVRETLSNNGFGGPLGHPQPIQNSSTNNNITSTNSNPITSKTLEHVFHGKINKRNKAVGFHYEGTKMEDVKGTKVDEITRSVPDIHGVYTAKVQVKGLTKQANSSFFPESWSKSKVV